MIIQGGVITGSIYVIPDTIELKPDKIKERKYNNHVFILI